MLLKIAYYAFEQCSKIQPIMLKIMFLKPKLCSQNQDYAQELTVLLDYISVFPDCCIRVSDCSIRVPRSYFHKV